MTNAALRLQPLEAEGTAKFPGGFTVLMAVHGGADAHLFERAVDSVFRNTLQPDAFVLVVDGPVPALLGRHIDCYERTRDLDVVRLPVNVGLACALNDGLSRVRTEWIARADADDVNADDRFAKQAAAICERGDVDLLGGVIREVDPSGVSIAVRDVPLSADAIARKLPFRNPFNHMTVVYRTAFVRSVGGYPSIHLKEDYALWATMIAHGARCANLPDVLVAATTGREMYRRRGGLRYVKSEIDLQRHLCRTRRGGILSAIAIGCARASAFCLPASLRGWIYEGLLRAS